jgi:4-amino-4-deoxy-L-arabinose transferase-like glycosyltransferase
VNTSCRGEGNSFYSWDGEKILSERQVQFFLVLSVLIGCVLRCWNINQSFWWDEIWGTIAYAKASSLWQVVSSLGYYFNNHIFYSLLSRGSIKILGESEVALRLPALVMGLIGIVSIFQFGKRFLSIPSGIISSFLLTISAFHIEHSSEARGYSGLALFSILSSYYFLKGLKTNETRNWILYIIFTVLGFYSHVFMIAVTISQCCCAVLFMVGEKWNVGGTGISLKTLRNFFLSLFAAAIVSLVLYAPVLLTFLKNIGKVRVVTVNRIPFILSLLNSFFPAIQRGSGMIVYSILLLSGIYGIFRKDRVLFFYLFVLSLLPVSLYLLINPMFVFERYFIFTLPFVLLIVSEGIVGLAENFKGVYRGGVVVLFLLILTYLQYPAISKTLHQDHQNYREAVRYVESETEGRKEDIVFSIGYAGEHFRYYSKVNLIQTPETFDEFSKIIEGKKRIWCLITAWLPDIRPPHEDKTLYSERAGQVEIYNYVKKNFRQAKHFLSKYPVDVYYLER